MMVLFCFLLSIIPGILMMNVAVYPLGPFDIFRKFSRLESFQQELSKHPVTAKLKRDSYLVQKTTLPYETIVHVVLAWYSRSLGVDPIPTTHASKLRYECLALVVVRYTVAYRGLGSCGRRTHAHIARLRFGREGIQGP